MAGNHNQLLSLQEGVIHTHNKETVISNVADLEVSLDIFYVCKALGGPSSLGKVNMRAAQISTLTLDAFPCGSTSEWEFDIPRDNLLDRCFANSHGGRRPDKRADLAGRVSALGGVAACKVSRDIDATGEVANSGMKAADSGQKGGHAGAC